MLAALATHVVAGMTSVAAGGWLARCHAKPGWIARHGAAIGCSYIALLTGFYVDNGPQLPSWNALVRNGALATAHRHSQLESARVRR